MTPPRLPAPQRPPPRPSVSPIWVIAALVGLMLLVNVVSTTVQQGRLVPYSEFKSLLEQRQVTEIVIGLDTIRGSYQDGSGRDVPFRTTFPYVALPHSGGKAANLKVAR